MDITTNPLGRRAFLGAASALATVTVAGLVAPPAGAAPASSNPIQSRSHEHEGQGDPGPERVALPDGFRPEGITSGPGTTYYAGSLATGSIVTGELRRATSRVLTPAAPGRVLVGMQRDRRSGLLWVAGSVGPQAHVYAVDSRTGAVVQDTVVPDGRFLNDVVVTRRAVWVTDSFVERLTRIALDRSGGPTGSAPTFLPLSGAWPAGDGTAINANGIRELADGSLVLNNSRVGGLWRVDPGSGRTTEIPVSGGPGITSGDGLELGGHTLYDVRGSGPNEVSVLRLRRQGDAWSAVWQGALTSASLDVPSTATLAGGRLWAVNARFGVASPLTAPYWISRLPARP